MTPRLRRLSADFAGMTELARRLPTLVFRTQGNPAETYELFIDTPGLAIGADDEPVLRTVHRCSIYLHSDYPRRPPVISWLTPIFHPNILPPDRNGAVCIGSWSAGESLADLVERVIDMVSYRSFNTEDALNKQAARVVAQWNIKRGENLIDWLNANASPTRPADNADEFEVLLSARS